MGDIFEKIFRENVNMFCKTFPDFLNEYINKEISPNILKITEATSISIRRMKAKTNQTNCTVHKLLE